MTTLYVRSPVGEGALVVGDPFLPDPGVDLEVSLVDAYQQPYADRDVDWFIAQTWGGAPVAWGTTATDSSGTLSLALTGVPAGEAWLFYKSSTDDNLAAAAPITLD